MKSKNIHQTTEIETIIPIYYIDNYQDIDIKKHIEEYKFKNKYISLYLLNIIIDICIDILYEFKDSNIIFTHPPSTMFYRKEKNIDSMGNLIHQIRKYINFYFYNKNKNYYFKKIFSIKKKYLKNKKAQHLDGSIKNRIKDIDKRYYLNFWNKRYIKENTKIIIIDDISSTHKIF